MKRPILVIYFLLSTLFVAIGQDAILSGKVTDKDNNPLEGVSISIKAKAGGTFTNEEENFNLNMSQDGAKGFITHE